MNKDEMKEMGVTIGYAVAAMVMFFYIINIFY